ncbi:hypothetical protein QBC39DRAFT_167763 [Podospora conica]|nr:hypothetical protein QBC39DRAFT_167763 [Schizothecium conicum]
MAKQPMSMEAMLDEERREVLALLEGQAAKRQKPPSLMEGRSSSPMASPRSPVRSMLDIGPPVQQTFKSMLDIGDSPPSNSAKKVLSSPSSPIETHARLSTPIGHPRSLSDASSRPADFGPRSSASRLDPTSNYQFGDILTNNTGNAKPKRVAQGGKRSSMAEVMRGNDVSNLVLPGDRGRHYSAPGSNLNMKNKSKSPHNRLGLRSNSPHNNLLGRPLSPGGQKVQHDTLDIDINNAYRRLSDAALARSGGSLADLARRKRSDDAPGSGRLAKDYLCPDGDLVEESSDENASSSEDEGERGRKTARSFGGSKAPSTGSASPETTRTPRSLMAAAEEERIHVAAQQPKYQYRSLLDPEITVTNPSGERIKQSKPGIHPATSFDQGPNSGTQTPMDSDAEADISDIKRAQRLSFSISQIMNTPESQRTIQIITRGEYSKLVQEAEDEHRNPRKYLVATDLSDESTHALEWAIGTVLRDGDTLVAIYCADEESGIYPDESNSVPDENKSAHAAASAPSLPHPQGDSSGAASASPGPSGRERSKAEEERFRAVHEISEKVTKLIRKTRLQVQVIVEVLHCKNPKHLITEVIDLVNPTLVILGSRGRSALKGVILGSFSNYLVTKSSVPVMVARKRLRKQNKFKRLPSSHQINNINNPSVRSLINAKID